MFYMKAIRRVYLDNAATTPIDPKVLALMLPYLKENYGNPSSLHLEGRIAKKAIEQSRARIAGILGAKHDEIIFTSSGTEADNLAILGIAHANKSRGKHIITSCVEHKAVFDACQKLEKEGFEVTYLKVNKEGIISLEELKNSLRADTILVSIMYANNEIGSIQPIKEIAKVIHDARKINQGETLMVFGLLRNSIPHYFKKLLVGADGAFVFNNNSHDGLFHLVNQDALGSDDGVGGQLGISWKEFCLDVKILGIFF